ncbi:Cysteine--tRNA ligase, chloroplastic/mitochondrial-like protein [Drosera capensis]
METISRSQNLKPTSTMIFDFLHPHSHISPFAMPPPPSPPTAPPRPHLAPPRRLLPHHPPPPFTYFSSSPSASTTWLVSGVPRTTASRLHHHQRPLTPSYHCLISVAVLKKEQSKKQRQEQQRRKQSELVQSVIAVENVAKEVLDVLGQIPEYKSEVLEQLKEKALVRAGMTEADVTSLVEEWAIAWKFCLLQ